MEEGYNESTQNKQVIAAIALTFLLIILGVIGYIYIKKSMPSTNQNVLNASTTVSPTQSISPTPQAITNTTTTIAPASTLPDKPCSKNGPAQKWEYLISYTVKDGDTLDSVATTQLHDSTRVNEILQLNGTGPYVVGSIIYLPPPSITKSSGNIKQVSG